MATDKQTAFGLETGYPINNKKGDPDDQGTRASGLNYDRGDQDDARGNAKASNAKDKVLTRDGGGKITNGHGRW